MKKKILLKITCIVLFLLCVCSSCKPYFNAVKENFDIDAEIEIPFYIFTNCEDCISPFDYNSPLKSKKCCDTLLFDSITTIFSNYLFRLNLNISEHNRYNKYEYNQEYNLKHNELIDTTFIKRNIGQKLSLVPIISYIDFVNRVPSGYHCGIAIELTVLIYEEKCCIYSTTVKDNFIVFAIYEDEFIKSELEVENLIRDVVDKALAPYIERAK